MIDALEQPGTLAELRQNLQADIDECYEEWLRPAVQEALELREEDASQVSASLLATAGGEIAIEWQDPRDAARKGRTQQPSWAAGCDGLVRQRCKHTW